MIHDNIETTSAGNPKAPPMIEYLGWITNAWEELPEELISKSFKICGITTATNGSEDDQIHCFKPEGAIPTGLDSLRKERNETNFLEMIDLINEIDLIQDEENGILSDDSLEF